MTINVTITKPGVTDQYGRAMVVGTTYAVDDNFGLSLIQQLKATDTNSALSPPGFNDAEPMYLQFVNQAAITNPTQQMLNSYNITYAQNTAPYTEAYSVGNRLVSIATTVGPLSTDNTTAAAPANTTAIQAALNAGGLVQITTPGQYRWNSTLTIYDRTTLVLGAGVELVAIPSSGPTFTGIQNSNANSTPITINTITAVAIGIMMARVTVTFASAHGLVARNFVEIKGDGADVYNGVWEVETAPSATTLTFIMSLASGSSSAPPDAAVSVASAGQTVATPGVFATAKNAFFKGQAVTITGTPPTGFSNNTTYYVIGTGLNATLSGVQITGTAGQFSCTAATLVVGMQVTISGTFGGTGSITGYANPTTYIISATNGSTTFTLQTLASGAIVTTAGTPTGLTYTTASCQLADSPFASTGKQVSGSSACTIVPTIQGSPANGYIQILGPGKLNMNYVGGGFSSSNSTLDHGIVLRRVLEPVVDGLVIQDVRKYGVMMQDVQNPKARNLHFDTESDGVHIYGPAWNPLIENITGTTGDDTAIFQPIDGSSYTQFMLGTGFDLGGNFYGGTMRNIRPRHIHNSGACVIYPNGNSGGAGRTNQVYAMRGQILIDGGSTQDPVVSSTWQGGNSVLVGGGYTTVAGTIDTLTIRNTQIPNLYNGGGGALITINNMTWDGITNDQFNGTNASTNMDVMTVNNFVINGANIANISSNTLILLRSVNATINNLTFNNCVFTQLDTSGIFSLVGSNGGNLGVATYNNVTAVGGVKYMTEGNGSYVGTPVFVFNGGYGQSGYAALVTATGTQNLNVHIRDFKSVSPSVGVFNFYSYSGTLNLWVTGLEYTGGLFANLSGSNNSIYNPDGSCPVDLSKIARTAGCIAKSAAGNGTIVAGNLAVCDATGAANSWKQISNTTLVY